MEKDQLRRAFTPLPAQTDKDRSLAEIVSLRIRAEAPLAISVSPIHSASAFAARLAMVVITTMCLIGALTVSALAAFRQPVDQLSAQDRPALPLAISNAEGQEGAQVTKKGLGRPHSHLVSNNPTAEAKCPKCQQAIDPDGTRLSRAP